MATHAGFGTRRADAGEASDILRRSDGMRPFDARFDGRDDFIHTDDGDDLFRPIAKGGDAVAVAIDIDELPVLDSGVGPHEERIAEQGLAHQFDPFFRRLGRIAVDDRIVFQYVGPQADFIDGYGTAPGHDIRFGNIRNGLFQGFFLVGQYTASKPRAANFLATKAP